MAKQFQAFCKFVRLNLIGEIVEVTGFDSTGMTINFKGQNLMVDYKEVSPVTSEEVVVSPANCISD
jgi:hypothetical protein